MDAVFDVVVIGAGVNGSGASLYLAKAGKKTALIEQFLLPHVRGSSGGQSRIIRYANYGHQCVSPLMRDSFHQWRRLEEETGTTLMTRFPFFTTTRTSDQNRIAFMKESLEKSLEEPVWWSANDMNREYKTTFPPDTILMEDAKAGILFADKGIAAIQSRFRSLGGVVIDGFPVQSITPKDDVTGAVVVQGPEGILRAEHVVICAGPWSSKLLEPLGLHLPLKTIRVPVFYWPLKDKSRKTFSFVSFDERFQHVFGLPVKEYPGLVKISIHGGKEVDPDARDCLEEKEEEQEVKRYIEAVFPWVHPEVAIRETCMYTMTPDSEAIIDFHPKYRNIIYACGFSGTGFKTGLTVGQVLTEMVLGQPISFDMSAFKADRFQNKEGKSKL